MNKSLLALATGSFALGFAEFVMMGILPATATGLRVSVPDAGDFISAYALGVCAGTLFLVFGRRVPPKRLLLGFVALVAVGNAAAACAPSAEALVAARFVSGLPHGAFFGTATIVARELADPGREGQAVSIMVLGQTVANMVGVPGGTLLAALLSWRATFLFVAVWAVGSLLLIARFVPAVRPIPDAGLAGQFRFLKKPGPWLVIGAVLLGNTGIFCWWSYVSPWLTDIGGFPADALPALLVLAGFGMVAGSLVGGRLTDRTSPGKMAAAGQAIGGGAHVPVRVRHVLRVQPPAAAHGEGRPRRRRDDRLGLRAGGLQSGQCVRRHDRPNRAQRGRVLCLAEPGGRPLLARRRRVACRVLHQVRTPLPPFDPMTPIGRFAKEGASRRQP